MSSNLAETTTQQPWPRPNGDPASWVWIDDLTLPAEVEAQVGEYCRKVGYWWTRDRRWAREQFKLGYYFPGMDIAMRRTERGLQVLMVGDRFAEPFDSWLQGLPRPERCKMVIWHMDDPNDDTTWI